MLGLSSHEHKVNFCKFTNETRNAIEDATKYSDQTYITAINGVAAGGGYELALSTEYIILVDDNSSAISLPEVPLLAVLPGTGGLTRVVDKRNVRRDYADYFCTLTEGIRGKRTVNWNLVDELVSRSKFEETVQKRALDYAKKSKRPKNEIGIKLFPLKRNIYKDRILYENILVEFEKKKRIVNITIKAPSENLPSGTNGIIELGSKFWPLAMARELDDLIMHLSFNEPELGTWVFRTHGDAEKIFEIDSANFSANNGGTALPTWII